MNRLQLLAVDPNLHLDDWPLEIDHYNYIQEGFADVENDFCYSFSCLYLLEHKLAHQEEVSKKRNQNYIIYIIINEQYESRFKESF